MPLLEIRDMAVAYGRIEALRDISIDVNDGELVTLIGANGAGKTTTMRAVSGIRPLSRGSIVFDGVDITRLKAHLRVREGIVQAPEGRGVFPGMSVTENLEMGCYGRKFASSAERRERLDWVFATFPRLAERRSQVGGTLSGGEQQMLAIGRALMTNPRLLVLDEATEGLAPVVRQEIWAAIHALKGGLAILVIDKTLKELSRVADRCFLIERGKTVWTGAPGALTPELTDRYLGV